MKAGGYVSLDYEGRGIENPTLARFDSESPGLEPNLGPTHIFVGRGARLPSRLRRETSCSARTSGPKAYRTNTLCLGAWVSGNVRQIRVGMEGERTQNHSAVA